MSPIKMFLLGFVGLAGALLLVWLAWSHLETYKETRAWPTAPAVVQAVRKAYADKFERTIVRGTYQEAGTAHEFEVQWGIRLAPEEVPAVGTIVRVRFDPHRLDRVVPDRELFSVGTFVIHLALACLLLLGTAVLWWNATRRIGD